MPQLPQRGKVSREAYMPRTPASPKSVNGEKSFVKLFPSSETNALRDERPASRGWKMNLLKGYQASIVHSSLPSRIGWIISWTQVHELQDLSRRIDRQCQDCPDLEGSPTQFLVMFTAFWRISIQVQRRCARCAIQKLPYTKQL